MASRVVLSTRVPEPWLKEIDELIARKFQHRTRSEWLFGMIEHELMRQREGKSKDVRIDQLLTNGDEVLTLLREVHQATVKG